MPARDMEIHSAKAPTRCPNEACDWNSHPEKVLIVTIDGIDTSTPFRTVRKEKVTVVSGVIPVRGIFEYCAICGKLISLTAN